MTTPIDPVPAPATGRPVFFYTPHQDDETLFMGQVVAHHALAGRDVHVVSATDGSTSTIRDTLNGLETNGYWGGPHYPVRQQIPYLTPAAFGAARDLELVDACAELGVAEGNLHLDWSVPFSEGTLTRKSTISVLEAEALIHSYATAYPDAGHYTMWWGDTDPNHKHLGQALRNLALTTDPTRVIVDRRWLVRTGQTPTGSELYTLPTSIAGTVNQMVRCAIKPYEAWAPREGRYAIGYHSVPSLFRDIEDGKTDRIVKQP